MNLENTPRSERISVNASSHSVVLSRWVNERFPDWEKILSAHDVARLTRRPRWLLLSLMIIGRFPRRLRFRGCNVGWLRSDVLDWMTQDVRTARCHVSTRTTSLTCGDRQMSLRLDGSHPRTARRRRRRPTTRPNSPQDREIGR
jgi:predicted DNA-binding transcriptional regulator AlpA